jgi:hypothetical protein
VSFRRVAIGAVAAIALLAFLMAATWRTFHRFSLVARAAAPHGVLRALGNPMSASTRRQRSLAGALGAARRARLPAAREGRHRHPGH